MEQGLAFRPCAAGPAMADSGMPLACIFFCRAAVGLPSASSATDNGMSFRSLSRRRTCRHRRNHDRQPARTCEPAQRLLSQQQIAGGKTLMNLGGKGFARQGSAFGGNSSVSSSISRVAFDITRPPLPAALSIGNPSASRDSE